LALGSSSGGDTPVASTAAVPVSPASDATTFTPAGAMPPFAPTADLPAFAPTVAGPAFAPTADIPAFAPTVDVPAAASTGNGPIPESPTMSRRAGLTPASGADQLTPGETLGTRYHIIRLLAVGGMGAVYQAWDDELGVAVAIKTIRSDASVGDESQETERRFKRELVLARQVTHDNVLRIHDLVEVNGTKYITMPFIDGQDLAGILRADGKLPVPRALRLFRQVVAGVRAAHAKQIVHRDLKPANILIEDDHVYVMDFGIARATNSGTQMTMAGHVVGTLDYMAPEQAQGSPVDQRADIYALGLILQDMLVGRKSRPQTDNAITDLMKRMQAPLPPIRSIDPSLPESLEAIISRCVAIDPADRYQTTPELDEALAALDESGLPRLRTDALAASVAPPPPRASRAGWIAAVLVLVLGTASAVWYVTSSRTENAVAPGSRDPVSVLIANFENRTGDAVFDGALEQVLALGVEGATFITAYPRDQALRVVNEIAAQAPLDEERARLVSVREGIRLVLAGSIETAGSGYRVVVRAIDPANGTQVASVSEDASGKDGVIDVVGTVAKQLRRELGDAPSETTSANETFTTASIEAANAYARAQSLSARAQFAEAIVAYQEAVERDPDFGRAYSGWAMATYQLGRPEEADGLWKNALARMERMNEREKYRTLGSYYLGPGANDEQAITNYRALTERYPADAIGFNNLAVAYFNTHDFGQAVAHGRRVVEIFPKYRTARMNLALYMMYASDFDAAVTEARKALELGPADKAYLPLAIAALVKGDTNEALRAYDDMAKASARGVSIAAMGKADVALYSADYQVAQDLLERGAAADEIGKRLAPRAMKIAALADIAYSNGRRAEAAKLVDEALAVSRPDGVLVPAARLLIALGRTADAAKIAKELESQVRKRRRALGAVITAEVARQQGRLVDAIDALTAARTLEDLWLVRFTLGKVYVEAGRYADALGELEHCASHVGEAAAVYLDDWPTYRETAALNYWLARAQQGLGQQQSATRNYEAYLRLRERAPGDLLAIDARKRMAAR
jgi:tetratricopeptide (TPR) repeat protein